VSDDTSTTSAYTATLKAGASFDSPWLVVRADDVDSLASLLGDVGGVSTLLADTAKTLQSSYTGAATAPAPARAVAPQSQPQAPEPSPWDEPAPSAGGFTASPNTSPSFGGGGGVQGPNPNLAPKDDPYYAPKPGTAFDAQPAPQGPPGDKSGVPMTWRTGTSAKGPWRAWMSGQGRDIAAHLKDSPIFYR
jgi:hypothetical protein